MIKGLFSILALLFFTITITGQPVDHSLVHDGETREYQVFLPAGYQPGDSLPLVINLHGLGSDNFQQTVYSEFTQVADTAGFITVHPQGLEADVFGNYTTHWNANWATGVDDIGFIRKMIDRIHYDLSLIHI